MGSKHEFGKPRRRDSRFQNQSQIRSCTDVTCLTVFFLCILGAVTCSIIGFVQGDPERLIHPTDSDGLICGEGQHEDQPHLFFFDLLQCAAGSSVSFKCPTTQVCVSECPKTYFTYLIGSKLETLNKTTSTETEKIINKTRANLICRDGVDPGDSDATIRSLVESQKCAAYYVPSLSVLGRCVPSIFKELADKTATIRVDDVPLQNAGGEILTVLKLEDASKHLAEFSKLRGYAELIFKDITLVWKDILIGLGVVVVISSLWILFLQLTLIPIFITSALAFLGIFGFGGYWTYTEYKKVKEADTSMGLGLPERFISQSQQHEALKVTWLVLACISAFLCVLFTLIALILWTRIRVAIELVKEASKFIFRMPAVVIWPIIPFALQAGVLAFWIFSALYIASIGEKRYATRNITNTTLSEAIQTKDIETIVTSVPCDPKINALAVNELCEFVKYGGNEFTQYFQIFMLFMFLWLMNFLVALNQLVLAGAFTSGFWSMNKTLSSQTAIFRALWRALRYHIGSLAFGALLIALVQAVLVFLDFIDRRIRKAKNKCAIFLVRCLICCLSCIEPILKFINKNAYIMMAIYGQNFCKSSKEAFRLIMRNVLQTGVLDKVVDFITILSKLLIAGATVLLGYFWFEKRLIILKYKVPDLHFSLIPVIILTVGAYLVATVFFSVLDVAVNTLFLCFLEDLERHDGSPERPYYMSQNLMRVLGKRNMMPPSVRRAESQSAVSLASSQSKSLYQTQSQSQYLPQSQSQSQSPSQSQTLLQDQSQTQSLSAIDKSLSMTRPYLTSQYPA